jgi:hypothetical protein
MYTRQARLSTAAATGLHHGGFRRSRDLSRAEGALQPARTFVSQARTEATRPLFDLHETHEPTANPVHTKPTIDIDKDIDIAAVTAPFIFLNALLLYNCRV